MYILSKHQYQKGIGAFYIYIKIYNHDIIKLRNYVRRKYEENTCYWRFKC